MNEAQARALAQTKAEGTLATWKQEPWGSEFRMVEVEGCFWLTDRPQGSEDELDPSRATYFGPVESHTKPGRWVVKQNNTSGGGYVWIDEATCFETSF